MKRFADCARILQGKRPFAPRMTAFSLWEISYRVARGEGVTMRLCCNYRNVIGDTKTLEQITRSIVKQHKNIDIRRIPIGESHAREADPAG